MYRLLQKTHLWIGLMAGALFCISGLSGSVLVFDDELDAYFNSELWQVEPQPGPIRLNEATTKIRSAFPSSVLLYARLPREPNHSIEYWVKDEALQRVYIDPWRLDILGVRGEHAGLLGFLHDLHVHLLAGAQGLLANGILGLILLLMVVTGLWLAWPGWRRLLKTLRLPRTEARVARWFALHRSVGLISLLLLFSSALTGAAMVFHEQANAALIALFGGPSLPEPPPIEASPLQSVSKSPAELLNIAESAVGDERATWLQFPAQPSVPFIVRLRHPDNPHPNGTSYVALDATTGEILMAHDETRSGPGQQIADLKYPLHIGTVLGLPGRLVILVAGMMPTLLFVTGVYTWWRKRQKRRARLGKSPSPSNA
ncbi:PepSY-associated TM helix domain-containing protein [Nitrosococcus oceani]|uniref:PepSY-associated TM helix domain-containing protein n=1 Tax=Nitrosococcus oceani TaxID=1229 RepID=UPI0004E8EF42|nr:PepSY-associated TM helix domain-containing protein [Nitrosococcus oceani]KFI22468.1 peptidase [Nitrosococcus oceani]